MTTSAPSSTSFDYTSLNKTNSTSSSSTSAADSAVSSQQDTFMKLLVKQLQSQDPMNPMDNAQFTSQMAQINTVTQLQKLNASTNNLLTAFSSSQGLQASGLIGKSVLSSGNKLEFGGQNTTVGGQVTVPAGTTAVQVNIVSSTGEVVDKAVLTPNGATSIPVSWDGKKADGTYYPAGEYTIAAAGLDQNGKQITLDTQTWQKATSVLLGSSGVQVQLASGDKVDFSKITQIQ
ncbi:flagellar hook assembly protein FlgD [Andreprevotia chitinilytica]|uniref:flagellar hook assembly protein FlgD n=1 Tax=Andreprevotia chitinilytica TaxID=396808 RepID=UPI000691287C|nr:flagellar hook capping FlgD N-terminal domain-containing protein [Andreprevotia chitinilytica]